MRLNWFQKLVLGIASVLIALRLFHPSVGYNMRVDIWATLLPTIGILVVAAALIFLGSSVDAKRLWRVLPDVALVAAWLGYLAAVVVGVSQSGAATSFEQVNWLPTGAGVAGFLLLSGLTWLRLAPNSVMGRLRRPLSIVLIIFVPILVLVGALLERQYVHRAEAMRDRIVEGESVGMIKLGASIRDIRARFPTTFSRVEDLRTGMAQYDWLRGDEDWWIIIDPKSENVVAISVSPALDFDAFLRGRPWEPRQKLRFETTRGVRFNHGPETVSAVYGPPSRIFTFEYGRTSYDYASVQTEFEFVCDEPRTGPNQKCHIYSLALNRVTVYARGWSPEKVWGPGGRR